MKILNLKFKNINSLSGENEIDFTNPVFTNDGLFAITGKTGAGKSSILDAISLAFYGKTPRVEITGSENAVMTRGEKDCYSEIIFESVGKKWKSSWKQELNRNGNLKPVNRLIADCNNKIIADQVRTCDAKIVDIIGLTFEQFTKVIMLAQGSFTAFLQANKNNKGALLEQITGTEIYGEISKKVFDKNKIAKDVLDKILMELEAIKILSEDEIEALTSEIATLEKDKKQVDEALQKLETAKKWLLDLDNFQKQINEAKIKIPELEEKTTTAKEILEKSENALIAAKDEQKKQAPIFKKVSELDTKISERENLLQPILKAIICLENDKRELSKTEENQQFDFEKSQKLLIEKQLWATENKIYEELIANYSSIEKEHELLENSLNEIHNHNAEIDVLQKDVTLKIADAQKTSIAFDKIDKILTEKIIALKDKKLALLSILGGKELSELQSERNSIFIFSNLIKKLIDIENTMTKNHQEIEDFNKKIKQLNNATKELLEKIETDKKTVPAIENQINLLDETIKLTQTIQSLEDHRQHLKDGEECPLCGSLKHPFAIGNVPQIGEKEKELTALKKQFKEISTVIQTNEKNLASFISNKQNTLDNKTKEEKSLVDNKAEQQNVLIEIREINPEFLVSSISKKIEILIEILIEKKNEYRLISAKITEATNQENQLIKLRDKEIPGLQNEKQQAEELKNEAITAQKLAEQILKSKKESSILRQEKYNKDNIAFQEILKNYAVKNIVALKKCLENWNENTVEIEKLNSQISTLHNSITLVKKDLDTNVKSYEEKQKERKIIDDNKQILSEERKEIFAHKSVEEEENRLHLLVEKSEITKANAEKAKNESNTELQNNKAIVTSKEKDFYITKSQKITDKTIEELQEDVDKNKKISNDFSQKIGEINQIVKHNSENLKNCASKLKEKEKQQTIANKWGQLNELIGSSDGKKYRNFAQALTFEHLVGLSNRQLQKMSDRYILKRIGDHSNPFELSVIDKFQNSEERTAQNLSGGEKFIVSLSLALGLSNMASKNMPIDTMFIDEGFGTLDSDYLDIALNALSNLQSEGKIIGVISHLTELKERIATHIEVVPSGNGHSKIQITN